MLSNAKMGARFHAKILERLTFSAFSILRRVVFTVGFMFVLQLRLAAEPEALQPTPSPPPITAPTWKEETAKGYLPYHQLTTDDFPIRDRAHPEAAYWVQTFVHPYYHYLTRTAQRGGYVYAYIMDWTLFSGFDKNTSSRKSKLRDMKAELPYAQAILDIHEIFARRLAALKPGELPSGEGKTPAEARQLLEERLNQLFQSQASEARKEVDSLATATKHGQNKKKVRELSAEIKKRLAATAPAPASTTALPAASPSPQASTMPAAQTGASP